ncbi:hypothetical protein T08_949, partial [Trichinella sp. T8]
METDGCLSSVHQMLKKKKYLFLLKVAVPLLPHCFHSNYSTNVLLIQFFLELKITFALLHLENGEMQSIIGKD